MQLVANSFEPVAVVLKNLISNNTNVADNFPLITFEGFGFVKNTSAGSRVAFGKPKKGFVKQTRNSTSRAF